jgi:hypothetical protein
VDMLSEPAPIPISIMPVLMALAMSTHAWSPDEHCRFSDLTADVTGKPAASAAARNSVAPPPGARTVPTAMSSTRLGSILEREIRALKAPVRRSADCVSLKPPLPPLVKAVRRAHVMTTWEVVSTVVLEVCHDAWILTALLKLHRPRKVACSKRPYHILTSSGFFSNSAALPFLLPLLAAAPPPM